jgi:hypothetical protein
MNKKRITGFAVLSLLAPALIMPAAHAASPRSVTAAGAPYKWDNSKSIVYDIDQGPLGKLSNTQAADLVTKAFQQWSSVKTAKLTFEEGDPLDRDVTGANLSDFLNGLPSDVNPVIFDNDGSVTDSFLGNGASETVLTVGGPYMTTGTGLIAQGILIINARSADGLFDPSDPTTDDLTRAIVRGIGQMIGVGSSDTNDELVFDGNVANNNAVPVMHPATGVGNVIGGGFALTLDDQMSVSSLYPSDSFATSTGMIQGQVLLPDGTTGLQGIDVIARKVDDPVNSAVSAISGTSFRVRAGRGADDVSQRGAFQIPVPPGNYTLEFRPLSADIGPLTTVFPLPGGRQFYQASGTPSQTAGPAVPASATPVTVTAGQVTTVKFVAAGKAAPAPQAITQVKPDGSPVTAQLLPVSATVSGNVSPMDPAQITVFLGTDSSGNVIQDKLENLYRLVVPETSILTLFLQPKDKVVLGLYLMHGFLGGANPPGTGAISLSDTGARSLQLVADPGTYVIGVSTVDAVPHPAATDYTLSVTTTPLTEPAAPPVPVLNQLVVGDITDSTATASWVTDLDTTGDALAAMPRQEFGDPMASKAHRIAITGLTGSQDATLTAVSQSTDNILGDLPRVFFHTADKTPATGPTQISAAVLGILGQTIGTGDATQDTILVQIGIRNSGAPATNVQITGLTPSSGWMLAQPLAQPLTVGGIGSNGTAIAVVRLLRQGTGPAPVAAVTGTGTLTGADGATANFTITGP